MSRGNGQGAVPDPGRDATILVVDDEADVRTVVRLIARRQGYRTVEAANGQEAIDVLTDRTQPIDAVVLDVTMPVMTGHEALPKLRELVPDLPVVLISGYDRSEVAQHLSGPTAQTDFLPKPFTKQQLLAAISRAVTTRD